MSISGLPTGDSENESHSLGPKSEKQSHEEEALHLVRQSMRGPSIKRMRISDEIFNTYKSIVEILRKSSNQAYVRMEVDVEKDDAIEKQTLEINAVHAAAIIASAEAAIQICNQTLLESEQAINPVEHGVELAGGLLKSIEGNTVFLEDLVKKNILWKGLSPLSGEPESFDLLQEDPMHKSVLKSKSGFSVDEFRDTNDQMRSVVGGIAKRIIQLRSKGAENMRIEMRDWNKWMDKIWEDVDVAHADHIKTVYERVCVPRKELQLLVNGMLSVRRKAQKAIEMGGFLHDPDDVEINQMIQKAHTHMLCEDITDPSTAFGYYSVVTDHEELVKLLNGMCGYVDGETYTEETLPAESGKKWKMVWTKPREVVKLFNTLIDQLAVSIEVAVAVKKDGKYKGEAGAATALKKSVYEEVLAEGKTAILLRHFEIIEVNGQSVSATNVPSKAFIDALGGKQIGTAEETFMLKFGEENIAITVLWYLYLSDIEQSIERINERK